MHNQDMLISVSSQGQKVKSVACAIKLPFVICFPQATPVEDGGEVEEAGEEDRPDSVASKTDKKEPKLTNQFNFSERASQTLNNPLRVGRSSIASHLHNG